ncbi:NADH-quinone oxidoreductase subunit G [Kineosphaera limosa]|uniref:NADH-quinone oxidoreductase n=1 Tax=Kineosphaera limosa NBRC 100340 TaxID=1184609 RepID=K6WPS3_9MICO|nr:NADH-quinone oxidoreductase subunit G [Kineosphaera limosa]NYE02272.1 NADH-quinone oxidoreductase subunit G [Kineosphaera limosa]GAB94127.1 NADH-quinone oxidoreductase subunit G [Kineosphaera limosa NBRC 100340]
MTVPTSPASGANATSTGGDAALPAVTPKVEMVDLSIDGVAVSVPKGSLVIRAAEQIGIEIPRFCDHPLLEPAGACRQCLVDVATPGPDGSLRPMPKPQASCTMTVSQGMEVKTQHTSAVVDKAQQGVMELLLINHPLDCPVCDKGGECPLQNQAMSHGRATSRFDDVKRTFPKPVNVSAQVLLDRERCVLCQRCTRFSDQIAGDPFIALVERGAAQQIGVFQDEPFDSYFSGNTVQICPVGALTGAMYRFRSRPFDLVSTPSVCEHCASGCHQRTDHRRGTVLRRMAANTPAVNEEWNCDKGRWAFQYAVAANRLDRPLVRDGDGQLQPVSWSEAIAAAAKGLSAAREAGGVGVLTGGRVTAEDAYAYSKFARVVLGTNDIDCRARAASTEEADFLAGHVVATSPGHGGVSYDDLENAPAVLLVGLEPEEESPMIFLRLRKAARKNKAVVFSVAPFATRGLTKMTGSLIQAAPGTEVGVLDALGNTGGELDIPAQALTADGAVILVGERLATVPGGLSAAARLAQTTGATLAWVPRRAGERGAIEAGALPGLLPGGRPVVDAIAREEAAGIWGLDAVPNTPGRDTVGMLEAAAKGTLSGLLVGGVELSDLPGQEVARAAVERAFVVSLELRSSLVTDAADVVLPVAAVAEKAGTFVDWEGRPGAFDRALTAETVTDARVLDMIAAELGEYLGTRTVEATREEMREFGAWGGPRPRRSAAPATDRPRPGPGQAVLATWHHLLDAGRMQDGDPFLAGTAPVAQARISPSTAHELGVADGSALTVSTERGSITLPTLVTPMVDHVVWLPSNSAGSRVRATLDAQAGDVVNISKGGVA